MPAKIGEPEEELREKPFDCYEGMSYSRSVPFAVIRSLAAARCRPLLELLKGLHSKLSSL
eukprot:jgi/Bigna1/63937/fgenesh1_kg.63_\